MIKKLLLFFLSGIFCFSAKAKIVRIGLLSGITSSSCTFIVAQGHYQVISGNKSVALLVPGESLTLTVAGDSLDVMKRTSPIGKFGLVRLVSGSSGAFFRLKSNQPVSTAFPYQDNLEVKVSGGKLRLVNLLDLEKYVASVVESESGDNFNPEFLKVQAILVRTYALNDLHRHTDGYSLCDAVHCQVYRCRNRFNPIVERAVGETKNKVLCDERGKMVMSVYHSNCGGQTLPSGDLWSKDLPCIVPVIDTFCTEGMHARWTRTISKREWKKYLRKNLQVSGDSIPADAWYCFDQPERQKEFCIGNYGISLKKIRGDWQLKSTFFSIDERGDSVVFSGRGFGHGVGLCQEGAMEMTAKGFTYKQILQFYFSNVKIVDAKEARVSRN